MYSISHETCFCKRNMKNYVIMINPEPSSCSVLHKLLAIISEICDTILMTVQKMKQQNINCGVLYIVFFLPLCYNVRKGEYYMKQKNNHITAFLTAITMLTGCIGYAGYTPASAADKLLAFPGATGAGRYATGGRGGEVYHVTNLNDSGTGSLRDAVSKPNRIVVFDVSGTIELEGNIICSDNITIAGQTAPGGSGVTLKNYKFGMGGNNIIVRYLSSRPGPDKCTSSGNDGWGGAKGSYSIIDHCSLGWTTHCSSVVHHRSLFTRLDNR